MLLNGKVIARGQQDRVVVGIESQLIGPWRKAAGHYKRTRSARLRSPRSLGAAYIDPVDKCRGTSTRRVKANPVRGGRCGDPTPGSGNCAARRDRRGAYTKRRTAAVIVRDGQRRSVGAAEGRSSQSDCSKLD